MYLRVAQHGRVYQPQRDSHGQPVPVPWQNVTANTDGQLLAVYVSTINCVLVAHTHTAPADMLPRARFPCEKLFEKRHCNAQIKFKGGVCEANA